jgi:LysM repeat protein
MRLRRSVLIVVVTALVLALVVPVSAANANASCSQYYTVRYGDSLSRIARYFGTTIQALLGVNYIPNPNYIYAGQVLCISSGYYPPPRPPYGQSYVVRYGDTLVGIARYLGVNVYALAQTNGIYNLNRIYAGQVLIIPYY